MARRQSVNEQYDDAVLNLALDTLGKGKQALVFCSTRKGAEAQAERIATKVREDRRVFEEISQRILGALSAPTKQCRRLAACVRRGVAFHHAGLSSAQREIVETEFRKGTISFICSTPTLAMGVDLPAFRTIIRDYKRYGAGTSWGMSDIPVLEYEQMCVPGTTFIKTTTGDIPIKEIVESNENHKVLTYDVEAGSYSYQEVVAKYRHRSREVLCIGLQRGYSLRLTGNHPIYVRRAAKCAWTRARELREGDEVLLTAKRAESGTETTLLLALPSIRTYLPRGGLLIRQLKVEKGWSDKKIGSLIGVQKKNVYHYKHNVKSLPLEKGLHLAQLVATDDPFPEHFASLKSRYGSRLHVKRLCEPDFFWLAGIIATDGTLTSNRDRRTGSRYVKVKIGNTNEKIIAKAKRILDRVTTGKSYVSKRGDGFIQLEKGATLLADILALNFGIPHGAKSFTVRAPNLLATAPLEYVGAFLAGVFDGDGSYDPGRRIHFASGSEGFARDIHNLLLRLGIVSSLRREKAGQTNIIKGKVAAFKEGTYAVTITKKSSIRRFAQYVEPVKCKIRERYSRYRNLHTYHDKNPEQQFIKVNSVAVETFNDQVYNIGVAVNNNYFANGILLHNCGRAGRPGKEDRGEAILIAKTDSEGDYLSETYVHGSPEDIHSKLAVEPVLRTYVLSLIASGYVHDNASLKGFFEETFYAFQYGDIEKLSLILAKMARLLEGWGFLEPTGGDFVSAHDLSAGALKATRLGERVAQLYLDPYTAHHLLETMEKARARKLPLADLPVLHLLCTTLEMRPLSNVRQSDVAWLDELLVKEEDSLLVKSPGLYSHEHEEFLQSLKTACVLNAWVSEEGEDAILERFNATPGELQAKRQIADWLLYALIELCKLKGWQESTAPLEKMRVRLEHGAREELLALLRLRGIGRVRGRILYRNGIRSIADVKAAQLSSLRALLGEGIALDLKRQVGEEVQDPVPRRRRKGQVNLGDFS